jgi:type VI secretion system protein ImpG
MRDELLGYYERELAFMRQLGAEFAQKYPKVAGRLQLEADKCEDPHVERLVEAFAFLAARVHLKIEDEFPEITESFLNVLYPHYLAPVPSLTVVEFPLEFELGNLANGHLVPRGTGLYSPPVQGTPCRFRTCYPVTLWPLRVAAAALESPNPLNARGQWGEAVLRLGLQCTNETTLSALREGESQRPLSSLRFYLDGEPHLVYPLYEMIFNRAVRIEVRPGGEPGRPGGARPGKAATPLLLPPSALRPVGFGPDEGLLPYTARSFAGYRLLTEYFAFPEKFLFFDVEGLDAAARAGGFGERFEILIHLRDVAPPNAPVGAQNFRLGCTPAVNLFRHLAEPILLTGKRHEYRVVPDVRRQTATEVYSVDAVSAHDPRQQQAREFQPFYSLRHSYDREAGRTFWYATRRPSQLPEDPGTEVYLSLVDLDFNPHVPVEEVLNVETTCTNRDLPARLPFGGRAGDLEIEGAAPVSHVRCLTKPSAALRLPPRRAAQWRLISHLSLNPLSLAAGGPDGAPEALREILSLYDLRDSSATRKQIAGITRIESRRAVARTGGRIGAGFVRGVEVAFDFDEEQYVGSGVYLFASVLERFLALYASVNSFTQLVARSKQREGEIKRWPPRAGEQPLL